MPKKKSRKKRGVKRKLTRVGLKFLDGLSKMELWRERQWRKRQVKSLNEAYKYLYGKNK